MNAETRIEAALLLDKKHWQERKQGGARPLRRTPRWALQHDEAIYEIVRLANNLCTLGEARDMIGKELRLRVQRGNEYE
jgi:hypothetical protein